MDGSRRIEGSNAVRTVSQLIGTVGSRRAAELLQSGQMQLRVALPPATTGPAAQMTLSPQMLQLTARALIVHPDREERHPRSGDPYELVNEDGEATVHLSNAGAHFPGAALNRRV